MSKQFDSANAYPLTWPEGFPRTRWRESNNRFDTTLFKALQNVQEELARFAKDSGKKLSDIIISSNYSLSDAHPSDPGVAIYFTWDGERSCIPVDKYSAVEDNLQAIYHCIAAKRTMLRHGGINLVKAAFRGYAALPPPAGESWQSVLGDHTDLQTAKVIYRRLISDAHPDRGGDPALAAKINAAWEQCQKDLSNQ